MEPIESNSDTRKAGDTFKIPDPVAKTANLYKGKVDSAKYGLEALAESAKQAHIEMWEILKEHLPDFKGWEMSYNTDTQSVTFLRKLKDWGKEEISKPSKTP